MKHNKAAFTLIELLVVVLIIGILTAVALPQYQKAVNKTKITRALFILRAIDTAQHVYYLANGVPATDFADLDIELPAGAVAQTPTQITYNDIWYQLYQEEGFHGSINFYDSTNVLPRLEKYYDNNYINCWHYNDNKQKEICLMLGGDCSFNRNCHIPW